jgi:hypothetical protein
MNFRQFQKVSFCAVAFLLLFLISLCVSWAGTEPDKVEKVTKKVSKTMDICLDTQKKEDAWAGEKAKLMARYRSLKANKEYLEKVKLKTEKTLTVQKALVDETERKIKEAARIREELQTYLESVVTRLEESIKKDLAFLSKERSVRLTSIKQTLEQPDRTGAEKYRRVMEALQIETGYGNTVEVYQETIEFVEQKTLMDILRVGRLSVFCQTPDGKVVGHFDRETEKWVSLPSKYRRDINKAVEMARRERTIELVKLPIGRIIP